MPARPLPERAGPRTLIRAAASAAPAVALPRRPPADSHPIGQPLASAAISPLAGVPIPVIES